MNDELIAVATTVAARLQARNETVAVAESSAGGLISAALLAVPGASAFFGGGAVVYTKRAKVTLLHLDEETVTNPRAATEEHALVLARGVRDALGTTWGVGETGATGPTGNRYGDPPGHACVGIVGPIRRATTVATGRSDRTANMEIFAISALLLLQAALDEQS